jgi:hypothetical protein
MPKQKSEEETRLYRKVKSLVDKHTRTIYEQSYLVKGKNMASIRACLKQFKEVFGDSAEEEMNAYIDLLFKTKRKLFMQSFAFLNFPNLIQEHLNNRREEIKHEEEDRALLGAYVKTRKWGKQ